MANSVVSGQFYLEIPMIVIKGLIHLMWIIHHFGLVHQWEFEDCWYLIDTRNVIFRVLFLSCSCIWYEDDSRWFSNFRGLRTSLKVQILSIYDTLHKMIGVLQELETQYCRRIPMTTAICICFAFGTTLSCTSLVKIWQGKKKSATWILKNG